MNFDMSVIHAGHLKFFRWAVEVLNLKVILKEKNKFIYDLISKEYVNFQMHPPLILSMFYADFY